MAIKPKPAANQDIEPAKKYGLGKAFESKIEELAKIQRDLKRLEERKKELSDEVTSEMMAKSATKIATTNDFRVSIHKGGTASISAKELVANGVGADIIEICTKRTEYWYTRIRSLSQEDEE